MIPLAGVAERFVRHWLLVAVMILAVLAASHAASAFAPEAFRFNHSGKAFGQLVLTPDRVVYERGETPADQGVATVHFSILNPSERAVTIRRNGFSTQVTDVQGKVLMASGAAVTGMTGEGFVIAPRQSVSASAVYRMPRNDLGALRSWSAEWREEGVRARLGFSSFALPQLPAAPAGGGSLPSPAPSPTPELPPQPPAAGVGVLGPIDATAYQRVGQFSVKAFHVRYGTEPNGYGQDKVWVYVIVKNPSTAYATLKAADITGLLDRRDNVRMPTQPMEAETGGPFRERQLQPGEEVRVAFRVDNIAVTAQRTVHAVTLTDPNRRTTAQFPLPQLNLDGTVGARTAPPAQEADASAEAGLKGVEGTFRTNQGTLLTLTVDGRTVTGRAVNATGAPTQREQMTLTLQPDGTLKGTWREEMGRDTRFVDVSIFFQPDRRSFSGPATIRFSSYDPPFTYSGTRVDPPAAPNAAGAGSNVGFKESGYMALRLDAVMRGPEANAPVEVAFTAKNYQGGRQSLQHNRNLFFVIGSNGVEYKSDGNFYGRSRADFLNTTVWVEGSDQAEVTYVFPGIPANVTPVRVIVRDGARQVGEFALAGAPTARGTSTVGESATNGVAGQPAKLQNYEVTLMSVSRGADRDWESVVTVTNRSEMTRTLLVTDITYVLYGADGQARHANGDFYQADAGDRRRADSSWRLPAGATARFRLWHRQSADLTPTRYRVQERGGEAASVSISADFLQGVMPPPVATDTPTTAPPPSAPSAPAGPSTKTDGNPVGTELRLGDFNATLIRIQRGQSGDWQSHVTIRNATNRPRRLNDGEITATLYAANGLASRGPTHYMPGSRPYDNRNPTLLPGETVTVIIQHFDSARVTPVQYQLHEPARPISRGGPVTP